MYKIEHRTNAKLVRVYTDFSCIESYSVFPINNHLIKHHIEWMGVCPHFYMSCTLPCCLVAGVIPLLRFRFFHLQIHQNLQICPPPPDFWEFFTRAWSWGRGVLWHCQKYKGVVSIVVLPRRRGIGYVFGKYLCHRLWLDQWWGGGGEISASKFYFDSPT